MPLLAVIGHRGPHKPFGKTVGFLNYGKGCWRAVKSCATRGDGEMDGKSHRLYWRAISPWAVASVGCTPEVKELALKDSGAVRCRPPRSRAWLRDRTVSSHEPSFHVWQMLPLPHNTLNSPASRTGIDGAVTKPHCGSCAPGVTEADFGTPTRASGPCSTPPDPARHPAARRAAATGHRCTTAPH